MATFYSYVCPECSMECSLDESMVSQNVLCPHCSKEFFATPPETDSQAVIPEKLPFFKFSRKHILKQRLKELVEDGDLSGGDEEALHRIAIQLELGEEEVKRVVKAEFMKEFAPIQERIEKSWMLTDEDLQEIEVLKRKYGVNNLMLGSVADLCRQIYLLEVKGQLPPPIPNALTLPRSEYTYFCVASTWHQTRVHRRGYSGVSVSVPTGIKGVRFRFGGYEPNRTEEITPLADGTLWVTGKRLFFQGNTRNTKLNYAKIVDTQVFRDCLKVEKDTGKADFFTMSLEQSRLVAAYVSALRSQVRW